MGKITITCRNRQVSIDGLKAIKVRVVSLNGAILESFLRYQVIKNGRGKTWHHENALAMSLLLEYWQATLGVYGSPRLMFEAFSVAIHDGTVQVDGTDPIGLRWKPRSPHHANKLIRYISEYSDWLYVETGEESALLNPIRSATPYEKMLNLAAYHHRKNNSFLKHTYDDSKAREQAGHVRAIAKHQGPKNKQVTYTFPRDKSLEVEDSFIICGSKISDPPQNRLDLAKVLVFMLMRYAGLRISEVPNIYVVDITVDPAKSDMSKDKKIPLVKVHHPDKGFAPDEWRKKYNRPDARRAEYLMTVFTLKSPKHRTLQSLYTGWKNPVLIPNQNYMIAYFNNTQAAEMFLIYWQLYLKYQAPKNQSHPFALALLLNSVVRHGSPKLFSY
ncbi:hypothetical protein [Vibrio anguillarum]|uniref:hypothetical protein n=1 Tax=Vibrio anguillarum TaxID=55601 RepID=UPI00038F276F|nr:hypothetical protein [Vibrio anguillarum]AGU58710.1 hypothetical protein N175_00580 [Vibrio anguillarum M3]